MNQALIFSQFDELRAVYPELALQCQDSNWSIQGLLNFSAEYAGQRIDDKYSVLILVSSDYPNSLPNAFETENRIPADFHKLHDGSLCFGELLAVKCKFLEEPTLLGFVKNCLIPYLYSYSHKCRYGKLPFGELSHGLEGILEHYLDFFHLEDERALSGLIAILAQGNYRGHIFCPCGSGKRLRSCHGEKVHEMMRFSSTDYFQYLKEKIDQRLLSIRIRGLIASSLEK